MKEALELVKPFYLMQIGKMLEDQANVLQHELCIPETHRHVMTFYYLNKNYPDMLNSNTLDKYLNLTSKGVQLDMIY